MVAVREIGADEQDYWDTSLQEFDYAHPFHAFAWGTVRKIDGWIPRYFVAEREGSFRGGMLILQKRLPFTPFSILSCPRGPVWDPDDDETLAALVAAARELGKSQRAILLRIDPGIPASRTDELTRTLGRSGFVHLEHRWSFWNAPRDVYRIDLQRYADADDYFRALKSKTRNYIRKAAKEGVTIEPARSDSELRAFYEVFRQFSVEKGFLARDYEYQREVWKSYVETGMGRLFLARYDGEIIGGALCVAFGPGCRGLHMGTKSEYRKLHTPYAYLWENVKWAKARGCSWLSLGGGVSHTQESFKGKFLPHKSALVGYYDLRFRRLLYKAFVFCEFTLLDHLLPRLARLRQFFHR